MGVSFRSPTIYHPIRGRRILDLKVISGGEVPDRTKSHRSDGGSPGHQTPIQKRD
jgi:hypothetical protein